MRHVLMGGAAAAAIAIALSGPVAAADLPLKAARPMVAPVPACMWCGLYVGGHIGYGWATFRGGVPVIASDDPILPVGNFSGSGFLVGLHAGYNWQVGRWVWGIEGDVTATPGWEKYRYEQQGNLDTDFSFGKLDALASIRGRLGMTFDRTLIYATGGIAFAKKRTEAGSLDDLAQHIGIRVGGVVGGGIEWKYNPSFSVRLEGLHYIFDEARTGFTPNSVADPFQHGLRHATTIRLGVSWHPQPF